MAQPVAIFLHAHHVVGHYRIDGRHDARAGQAAKGIDVVVRRQLARAGARKVGNVVLVFEFAVGKRVVVVAAVGLAGKGRVRLVAHARPDLDVVNAFSDGFARCVGGQRLALGIQILRRVDGLRGARHQFVGPLQIVIAVQRLVDVVGVGRFVAGIRACRIQVLGRTLHERGVERVLAFGAGRIRAVDGAFLRAARQRQQHQHGCCPEPLHSKHGNLPFKSLRQRIANAGQSPYPGIPLAGAWGAWGGRIARIAWDACGAWSTWVRTRPHQPHWR
ncbi:hypothetical protein D3C72_1494890 [compost metagenome]